ncbi:hypothetical protein FOB64_006003 [Candida albicans]|uniref:BBC1/AIM3 cysteine proteinase-fold domain-containing protein n=1 Tax=Candida albicans TaxID=5476 RepID=A0A8H6F299_CANAX|nr:hypothetical protein FOB64_006003 [Candida albicans]
MAKISGGRNMFGMMGMPTPFGAPPQRTPSTKKRDTAKESSSNTVTSHQRESVPPASEPPTSPISKSVSQKIPVPPSAIPVRVSDLASSEFSHDSSSIAEDDEESDIDRRQVSSNVLENEIGTDKTINLSKDINAEIEGAGYEADLSEAAKNEEKKNETEVPEVDSEQEEPHPPIPSRAPPVPVSVPAPAPAPAPAPTSAPVAAPPIPESNASAPFQSASPHNQLPQRSQSGSRPAAPPPPPPIPSAAVPDSRPPPPPIPVGEPPKRAATDFPSLVSSNEEKTHRQTVEYKDYYILWYDLSQLVIEVAYDVNDSENSARLINQYVKPTPPLGTGQAFPILDQATQLLGDRVDTDLVRYLFELNSDILPIIGNKSFGVTVYKVVRTPSVNNSTKLGEVLPGDILYIKGGNFSHKGLIGHKSTTLGEGEPYTAVIYEFDPVKEKFKVIEQDQSGHIIKGSYKISDMTSGRLRVFRPVGRQFVGW